MKNFFQLQKRIKKNEGYRNKAYLDVLGFPTIGYGHLITTNQKYLLNNIHSRKKLLLIFDIDFKKAVNHYLKFYKKKNYKQNIAETYIEMIFQLGIKKQRKFIKMNQYIEKNKLFMAAFEMKNSLWYKQTPKRVNFLINLLLKKKYEKKR